MEKKFNVSQIALCVLLILSAVVLIMFFGVGYGNEDVLNGNTYTAPQYTGLLIVWLYVLTILGVGVVFAFGLAKAFRKKSKKSVRTGFVALVFIFMFAVIAVAYLLSSSASIRLGDNSLCEDVFDLKLTDTCLYSIYVLSLVAIVAALLSMTGVFKAKIKK